MTEQEMIAVLARLQMADDPWSELSIWLKERSAINRSLGGDETGFASLVAMLVMQVSLPFGN